MSQYVVKVTKGSVFKLQVILVCIDLSFYGLLKQMVGLATINCSLSPSC